MSLAMCNISTIFSFPNPCSSLFHAYVYFEYCMLLVAEEEEEENRQNRSTSQRSRSQQSTRPLEPKFRIQLTCKKYRCRA